MAGETRSPEPKVWVVRAGKGGRYASEFEEAGFVAIGFDEAGDPDGLDRDALLAQTRETAGSRAGNIAGQVYRFARVMAVGDLVIVPDGSTRELLCGRVTGEAEYQVPPPVSHFKNVRTAEWIARRDRDLLPDRALFTLGSLLTVFEPSEQDLLRAFVESGATPTSHEPEPTQEGGTPVEVETSVETSAADQEARNKELIAKRIAGLGPYEMQDLVAGVLQALGYTTKVAPPGADGGVDIEACKDALFLHPPIVKAQVKARPGTKTSPDEIRQLNGLLGTASERGIFISTGGFTTPAVAEAAQMQVQLWDLPRLTSLFLDNYVALPEEVADLVSLRQIWVLDEVTDAEAWGE